MFKLLIMVLYFCPLFQIRDNIQNFIKKSVQKIESHTLYTSLIFNIQKLIIIYRRGGHCWASKSKSGFQNDTS